jgi:protoporphyrinogen oxidase
MPHSSVVIIGAGPAGLTAAYELTKRGVPAVVLEQRDKVGGLSRTEQYKGYRFDMGGHRFYTKSREVIATWEQILGKEFLRRPRLSRIFYNKKFFYYPLRPMNVLINLGMIESTRIILSYFRWQLFPHRREDTLEQWVTNRFGKRLFQVFFKTYTEKIWGIPCSELRAEWAAQRIKDLSLKTALIHMFLKPKTKVKTLIEEFQYPRLGPGMMWTAMKEEVEARGGSVALHTDVVRVCRERNKILSVVVSSGGNTEEVRGAHFISSMPITEFVKKLDPPAPPALAAAHQLTYRDFLTVCLIIDRREVFPDNWIYIHDSSVKVGRIQNFKNWSPDLVPDESKTSLGLEYFCNEGDEIWDMADADLIELGKREVERIGLARYAEIEDGCVFRVPKAYPVYDASYRHSLSEIRKFVDGLENFTTIGRNGLHRYNNQDHAMLTGMLAVRNLVDHERHDLWSVNAEQEYQEEVRETDRPIAPDPELVVANALRHAFAKVDRTALGLSVGSVTGLTLFLMTVVLVLKGGPTVGPHLQLLAQFFPGYSVTAAGSVIGLLYGYFTGFAAGWGMAVFRNFASFVAVRMIRERAERHELRRLLEYL